MKRILVSLGFWAFHLGSVSNRYSWRFWDSLTNLNPYAEGLNDLDEIPF